MHPASLERLAERFAGEPRRKSLWGVSPLAPLHIGYDPLILQQAALARARSTTHVVLLADLHAELISGLEPAVIAERAAYYARYLEFALSDRAEILLGSTLQTEPGYVRHLYKVLNQMALSKVRGAAPAQMKSRGQRETLSIVYLVMQCLDILELDVDLVFGEASQAKIYELTPLVAETLRSRREIEYAYVPGACDITGQPLGASTRKTRISFHDEGVILEEKVRRMYAPPPGAPVDPGGKVNALLAAFEWSVFPWREAPVPVRSSRLEYTLSFERYEELAKAYAAGDIHPSDCKEALFVALDRRFRGIREYLADTADWIQPERP